MKKLSALCVLFLLLFAGYLSAQDESVKKEIEEINNKMEKAIIDNDHDYLLSLYTEDAISLPSYKPMLKGRDAIKRDMSDSQKDEWKINSISFNTTELWQENDKLYEIGTYNVSLSSPKMDNPMLDNGKYFTIWEKEGGEWKVFLETWNTDKDPMQYQDMSMEQKDKKKE